MSTEESAATASPGGRAPSVFVPLLLLALAVAGWSVFQTTQLVRERANIAAAIDQQATQVEQSQKLRTRLESLATRTALLARDGNANATLMVEELRRRGITIDPDRSPPPAAP
ncbi:MAG: hypothetical protein L6Q83_01910 [Gammaproteobacteria bacterium]|nr:hypothetical protein [Gammaproteobacteria bacterium]